MYTRLAVAFIKWWVPLQRASADCVVPQHYTMSYTSRVEVSAEEGGGGEGMKFN